ncbi:MAG: AAA family ATPase [Trueperaceae bacterium]
MALRLRLLGPVSILVEGEWHPLPPHKTSCLLAFLAFEGEWTLRERLAYLFWPDSDEADARRNLRQLLQRVRQIPWLDGLGLDGLEIEKARLRWRVETDVGAFRSAIGAQDWTQAIEQYGGDLGGGLPTGDCPAYEAWLELERDALYSAWRNALVSQSGQWLESGRAGEAARLLQRLLEADPLAEDVLQQYLRCAGLGGERPMALKAFDRFTSSLKEELALEPLPETVALMESVRRSAAPAAAPHVERRSSGPTTLVRPPRTVGREKLRREALESSDQIVWLSGEAGSGKSRLALELAPAVPVVRCLEGLQSVPFAPVPAVVRAVMETGVISESLGGYSEDLARLIPELAAFPPATPEDPNVGRTRLLEALARLLEMAAKPSERFQLVFEDLQWADEATLELLSFLVSQERVRCLASYRSDEVSPSLERTINGLPRGRMVVLEPLDSSDVQLLLADLMGTGEGPVLFSRWLHNHSGGNPFFVLETLATLFETGDLEADAEGWHSRLDEVTRDYGELTVPTAVRDVISRRLRRLSAEGLRIIQALAVARTSLPSRVMGRISGLSEWAALGAQEDAEAAGLLTNGEFRHDLVRQVAYADLPAIRRALLHARVAEVLEGDLDPAVVAEHWLEGGEKTRALEAWLEAARSFRERGLHEEALLLLDRAEENAPSEEAGMRAVAERARILVELSRNEEALVLAQNILARSSDPGIRALMLDVVMSDLLLNGQVAAALELSDEALELARQSGVPSVIRQLVSKQAVLAHITGDFGRALDLWLPYLEEAQQAAGGLEAVRTLSSIASLYDALGRQREGLPLHSKALELARRTSPYAQVDVAVNLLYCYIDLGEPAKGVSTALETLALGRFDGTDGLRTNLAAAYLDMGDLKGAAEQCRCLTRDSNDVSLLCIAWGRLVDLDARLGNSGAAAQALEKCLELLPRVEVAGHQTRAIIGVLRYGTPEQVASLAPILERLDPSHLPPYLRDELEASLAETGGVTIT